MYRIFWVAVSLAFIMSCNEAKGADWRFFGGTTVKGEKALCYYDAGSVQHSNASSVKVWTKAVKQTDINKILSKKDKQIIKATAEKYANGYLPPYLLAAAPYDRDDHMEVIAWEQTANRSDVPACARVLYELKCSDNKIRVLSVTSYSKDGSEPASTTDDNAEWKHISPETNAEALGRILCRGGKSR